MFDDVVLVRSRVNHGVDLGGQLNTGMLAQRNQYPL